jgi:hypothetical protein
MNQGRPKGITLEFEPSPDGDNRLDVKIGEGETSVTYFSSTHAKGGARYIKVAFRDCYAVRYFVTEEHEEYCPGLGELESDFAEVCDSPWLQTLPSYVHTLKHFIFRLNHSFFECIAGGYRIESVDAPG